MYPLFPTASDSGLNKRVTPARMWAGVVGTTMKAVGTFAPDQCGDLCRQEPECKGYNWDDNYCELKSTVE